MGPAPRLSQGGRQEQQARQRQKYHRPWLRRAHIRDATPQQCLGPEGLHLHHLRGGRHRPHERAPHPPGAAQQQVWAMQSATRVHPSQPGSWSVVVVYGGVHSQGACQELHPRCEVQARRYSCQRSRHVCPHLYVGSPPALAAPGAALARSGDCLLRELLPSGLLVSDGQAAVPLRGPLRRALAGVAPQVPQGGVCGPSPVIDL